MDIDQPESTEGSSKCLSLSLSRKKHINSLSDRQHESSQPGSQVIDALDVCVNPPSVEIPQNGYAFPTRMPTTQPGDLMEIDDDKLDEDESFWNQIANTHFQKEENTTDEDTEKINVSIEPSGIEEDQDDALGDAAPMFKSLSVSDQPKPVVQERDEGRTSVKRKHAGEDVFTRECVKEWQVPRIKAWEGRYLNPEGYYYRFVVPGEGQQNGGWSKAEHVLFLARYEEWIAHGWKIGASWGLFSRSIPHRVGYQCMNYYRKLVSENKLQDPSYAMVDGKLKQIHKDRAPGGEIPTTDLGPEWPTAEVKAIEESVDAWLKEFHGRLGGPAVKATPVPRQKAAPRVAKSTSGRKLSPLDMLRKRPKRPQSGDEDDDFIMESAEPEQADLYSLKDWDAEWKERLKLYHDFIRPYLDPKKKHLYWLAKQEWRRGLATTEMLLVKKPAQKVTSSNEETSRPAQRVHQVSLSRFFAGVKKLKVDTPDELISNVRIPNDLYSGVKQIALLSPSQSKAIDEEKRQYYEVDNMMDCTGILNAMLEHEPSATSQSPLEGILVDPPWEYYIEDGYNDGQCRWNLSDMQSLLEKVVSHMSAGIVFVWTHKLTQAHVVRMMYSLDCKYVENLVWFKKTMNNVQLDRPSPYISSSKEILLMFKKGDGFELRHQRTADVIIDFEQPQSQWIDQEYTEPKPPGVYEMIETLLPKAGYDPSIKRGRFLELWAKKASPRREGWIAFHQRKRPPTEEDTTCPTPADTDSGMIDATPIPNDI